MLVEHIASIERLQALVPEWNELLQRAVEPTPFQTPEWLLPWWDVFGSGELFSFAAWREGHLAGLAPLFLHSWLGRRQVTFLGNGVSDRLNFILAADCAEEVARAILQRVASESGQWEFCDLQDLPRVSPLAKGAVPQYACMSIPLPGNVEQFRAGLPHGLRRNLRRYREQIAALGDLAFETASVSAFPAALNAMIDLHRARWASKNDAGMIDSPALERFHVKAASGLQERGVARLHLMKLDGLIRAVVYAMVYRECAYSYLGGFEPQLSRFSPGALILNFAIEQSLRERARVYDLLRGDEAYKRDWGAQPYVTYRLQLRQMAAA